ncbi:hypothetical protein Bca101_076213 [Brassica carinata]
MDLDLQVMCDSGYTLVLYDMDSEMPIQYLCVKHKIKKTASDLDVSESTAAILLVKYEWNAAQLLACSFISCGDCFCVDCLRGSVEQQLASNKLILSCPSQTCHKYLNFNHLPQDLLEEHLSALEIDLAKKTSLSGQCLSYLCNHKYALATAFCSLGYAVYTAFSWRKEIGVGMKVISVGSEVKSKVSSLKNFVTSGSKTLAGFFSA